MVMLVLVLKGNGNGGERDRAVDGKNYSNRGGGAKAEREGRSRREVRLMTASHKSCYKSKQKKALVHQLG